MKRPVISSRFYLACFLLAALVMAAPPSVHADDDAQQTQPAPARQVQTDMKLPHGFYFDENAQQYKKRERIVVPVENKKGETHNKRVIRTTCYNLQHETDSSRVFRPVACNR